MCRLSCTPKNRSAPIVDVQGATLRIVRPQRITQLRGHELEQCEMWHRCHRRLYAPLIVGANNVRSGTGVVDAV
jgi:hypothetical protein